MKILKLITCTLLILFWSCSISTPIEQDVAGAQREGISIDAKFYIPNWDAPKEGEGNTRVVDPGSSSVEIFAFNNSIGSFSFIVDENNIGSATIIGLEARKYEIGDLLILIKDSDGIILTSGNNTTDVTLSAQGTNSIVFSSTPYNFTNINVSSDQVIGEELAHEKIAYFKVNTVAQYTYKLTVSRTSVGGDLDFYIFDDYGRVVNEEYSVEDAGQEKILYFAPTESGEYYIAFKSFSGAVVFDWDVESLGDSDSAISGVISFPEATAGRVVYFKIGGNVVLEKIIGRTGDTSMYYVIPSLTDGTSGYLSVYIDRDIDSSNSVDDFYGYSNFSLNISGNHLDSINFELSLRLGISGNISVTEPQSNSIKKVMVVVNSAGWPIASYTPFLSSSSSEINYTTLAETGTLRVLYIYDVDGSGSGLSSVSNISSMETFFTDGDYYYLSDPVVVGETSITGINGSTQYVSMGSGYQVWFGQQ